MKKIKKGNRKAKPALNNRYTHRRLRRLGLRKIAVVGLKPAFVRFFSATFGAGVIASQCPITRPKRRIPKRYMQYACEWLAK